ncbi:sugar phosphate isomerase/epimerase [Opitutia bacterium ISCC 51]|nr:sugar phosphate isomerase/epimerase [Opitutae bacterium ISCC 51]QXD29863.1 sugar phosphate isomerase/epimerase [Opitutae bacterium ISCC 52]
MNRRSFLQSSLAALPLAGLATVGNAASHASSRRSNPIALSTYSLWRFRNDELRDLHKCIDIAAEYGFDGVELLLYQFEQNDLLSNSYMQSLKRHAFRQGLPLCAMSTHQGFVSPDKEERQRNIDLTIGQIEICGRLGIPAMRVNTGRWGTSGSFNELMADKGIEPPLPGYTEDDAFPWVIEAFEKCLPTAEKHGVVMGLENHWGLGLTAKGVLRIVDAIDSPWLQVTLDTGNFLENRTAQLEVMAERAFFVQAKTYYGGGQWYELDIDYPAVAKMLHKNNYHGWISLEFEGMEDYRTAIPKSLKLLRDAFTY